METLNLRDNHCVANDPRTTRLLRFKRCPDCYANMSVKATQCPACKQKLKLKIDKHGYAKKPINWFAYLSCLMSWIGLGLYIWWAFFKE